MTDGREGAGLGRRFAARVIDGVLLTIIGTAIGAALDYSLVWLVAYALVFFAYFVVLDVAFGTTIGKRFLGLRVIGPDGRAPTGGEAARREAFTLLGALPFIGPFLALAAWILIAVSINSSPTNQGKHDELGGGTMVLAVGRSGVA